MPKKINEEVKTEKKVKIEKIKKPSSDTKTSHKSKIQYYMAMGRRKTATARVQLRLGGTGKIIVNKKPIEEYFSGEIAPKLYLEPLRLTNNLDRFDIYVKVKGSGKRAQLGAMIHGLARALELVDKETYRPILKKQGFMTRDARARERRKPGQAGRARAKKQSPKR